MKIILVLLSTLLLFSSCDSIEPQSANISPMSVSKIEKIDVDNNVVNVTMRVRIGSPCWGFYKSEKNQTGNSFTAKIYAKLLTNDPCLTVMSSFSHEETIYFTTRGEKTIRFWQNDSTYLDTTLVL